MKKVLLLVGVIAFVAGLIIGRLSGTSDAEAAPEEVRIVVVKTTKVLEVPGDTVFVEVPGQCSLPSLRTRKLTEPKIEVPETFVVEPVTVEPVVEPPTTEPPVIEPPITEPPTEPPVEPPTVEPPAKKAPCNRGDGNGPEACDPGKSGGKGKPWTEYPPEKEEHSKPGKNK